MKQIISLAFGKALPVIAGKLPVELTVHLVGAGIRPGIVARLDAFLDGYH